MMAMFILLITGYREIGLKLQRSDVCQYSNTVFPFGWEILIFPIECYVGIVWSVDSFLELLFSFG